MADKTVLSYIFECQKRPNAIKRYLNGDCYTFAKELISIFGGNIMINRQRDHVAACIRGVLYDIHGTIPRKLRNDFHMMAPLEIKEASAWHWKRA